MADVVCEEYASTLNDLTFNSKPHISMLTMLAEENIQYAPKIVQVIEAHLQKVKAELKLPTMYLVDSIIKNIGGMYLSLFTQNIVSAFCNVFEKVDEKTRIQLFKLRQTWSDVFPNKKLYAIDVRVKQMDPAWPIIAQASIHVNPRFLSKTPSAAEESEASKKNDQESMQEAEMRKQLIAKQQELLKIQQQKLELELLQAKAKLEEQKKLLKQQKDQGNNNGKEEPKVQLPVADVKPLAIAPFVPDIPVGKIPNLKPQSVLNKESNLAKDPRFARDPRVVRGPNPPTEDGCKTDSITPVQQLQKSASLSNTVKKQHLQASVADLGNSKVTPSLPIANESSVPQKLIEKNQEKQVETKNQNVKLVEPKKQEIPIKSDKSPKKKLDKDAKKTSGKPETKLDSKPLSKDLKKETKFKDDSKKNVHIKKEKKTDEKIGETDIDKNIKHKIEKEKKNSPGNKKDHEEKYDNCKTNKRDIIDRKDGSFVHKPSRNRRIYRSNRKDSESPDKLKRIDEKNFMHEKVFKRYRDKEKIVTNRGRSRSPLHADKSSNKDEKRLDHKSRKILKMESENKEKAKGENYQIEKADSSKLNEEKEITKNIDVDFRLSNNKDKILPRDSEAKENKEIGETMEEPPAKKVKQVETDENLVDELFGCKDQDYRQMPPSNSQSHHQPCSPAQGGWAKYKAEHPDEFKSPLRPMKENVSHKNPFGFGTQDLDLRLLHKSENSCPINNASNESSNAKQNIFGFVRGKHQQSFRKNDPKAHRIFNKQGKVSGRLPEDPKCLRKHPMYQRLQSEDDSHPDTNLNIPNALMFERQAEVLKQAEQQLESGQITSEQYREIMNQLGKLYELQVLRQKQKEEQFKERLFSNRRRDSYGSTRRESFSKYGNVRSYNLGEMREDPKHSVDMLETLGTKDNSDLLLPSAERKMNLKETKKVKTENENSFRIAVEDKIKPLREKNFGNSPSTKQSKDNDMDIEDSINENSETVKKEKESLPTKQITSEEKNIIKKLHSSDSREQRTITIDDQKMNIRAFGSTAIVYNKDTEPREVLFLGSPADVFIGDQVISLGFEGDTKVVVLDGKSFTMKFGAPSQEIYIDNTPYEARFEGPPIEVVLNSKVYKVRLGGPIPKVEFRELSEELKSMLAKTEICLMDNTSTDNERNFENKAKYNQKEAQMTENVKKANQKETTASCFSENQELNKGRISELSASREKSRSPIHYGTHRPVIPDSDERREPRELTDYRKSRSPLRIENRSHVTHDVPDNRGMAGSHYDPHFSGPQHGSRYDNRHDQMHPDDRSHQERHLKDHHISRHGFREHFPFRERRDEWREEQWRDDPIRHQPEEPIYRGEHPYPRNYDVRNTRDLSHRDEYVPSYWHRNDLQRDEPRAGHSGPQHEDIIPGGHLLLRDRGPRQNSPQHLMEEYPDNSRMMPYRQMPPYRENMPIREAMPRGGNIMGPRIIGPRPRFDVRHRFDGPRPRFEMRIRGESIPRMEAVRIRDDRILMPNPMENTPYIPEAVHQLHGHPMGPQDYYPSNIIPSRPDYVQHPDPNFAQLPPTGFQEVSQEVPATLPNPVPQVDINELFQKLVVAGILGSGAATEVVKKEEEKETVQETVIVKEEPVIKSEDADGDKIPSIEFTSECLKAHYSGVIAQLYKGIQCSSCGVRFTSEQTEKYAQHLDWHFRQNRRERDSAKKATSRKWFYDTQDWIQFEEVEDLEERARSFFEIQAHEEQDQTEELPSVPVGENEEDNICVVCGEPFEQFWDEEKEEWHLRDALRIEEKPYHPVCFEDIKNLSAAEHPSSDDHIDQDIEVKTEVEDVQDMDVDLTEPIIIKKENELDVKEKVHKDVTLPLSEKIDCSSSVTEIQDHIISQVKIIKDPDASVTSVSQCLEINKNVFVDSMPLLSKDLTTINVTDSAITKIKDEPINKPIIKIEPVDEPVDVPTVCNVTVEKPINSTLCNVTVKQEPLEDVEPYMIPIAEPVLFKISNENADINVNGSKSSPESLSFHDSVEIKENETTEEAKDEQNAEVESDEHEFTVLPPVMKGTELSGLCTIL